MRRESYVAAVVGLAFSLSISSCAHVGSEGRDDKQSQDAGESRESPESLEGDEEQSSPPDKRNSTDPPEEVDTVTPVASDMLTLDAYLESFAVMYRIDDPPEVEVIREVDVRERVPLLVQCLQEQGFDAYGSGGGWGADYPSAQQEAFNLAIYTCEAHYPLMPVFYRPYDVATLHRIYDHYEETVLPCVQAAGWDVDLVTREQFISRYEATRELGTDFFDLPAAIIADCYDTIPP